MPVVRVAGEAARAHHQPLLVRHRQADLHAELVRVACLPLGDAFHLGSVQRIQFVLGMALLGADALGALQQSGQIADGLGSACLMRRSATGGHCSLVGTLLALHFSHHHAQDRALALDGLAQPLELLGMALQAALGQIGRAHV